MYVLPDELYEDMEKTASKSKRVEESSDVFEKTTDEYVKRTKENNQVIKKKGRIDPVLNGNEKRVYRQLGVRFFRGAKDALAAVKDAISFRGMMRGIGTAAKAVGRVTAKVAKKILPKPNLLWRLIKGIGFLTIMYVLIRTLFGGIINGLRSKFPSVMDKVIGFVVKHTTRAVTLLKKVAKGAIGFVKGFSIGTEWSARIKRFLTDEKSSTSLPGIIREILKDSVSSAMRADMGLEQTDKEKREKEAQDNASQVRLQVIKAVEHEQQRQLKEAHLLSQTRDEVNLKRDIAQAEAIETAALHDNAWISYDADFNNDILSKFADDWSTDKNGRIIHNGKDIDTKDQKAVAKAMIDIGEDIAKKVCSVDAFNTDPSLRGDDGKIDTGKVLERMRWLVNHGEDYDDKYVYQKKQFEALTETFGLYDGGAWTDKGDRDNFIQAFDKFMESREKSLTAIDDNKTLKEIYEEKEKLEGKNYHTYLNKESHQYRTNYHLQNNFKSQEVDTIKSLVSTMGALEGFILGGGKIGIGTFVTDAMEAIQVGFKKRFAEEANQSVNNDSLISADGDEVSIAYSFQDEPTVINFVKAFTTNTRRIVDVCMKIHEDTLNHITHLKQTNWELENTLSILLTIENDRDTNTEVSQIAETRTLIKPILKKERVVTIMSNLTNMENYTFSDWDGSKSENRRG